MYNFFLHLLAKSLDKQVPVTLHEHLHDTTEGSEFLDDALRMKDQPLTYTKETLESDIHNMHSNTL